MTTRTLFTAALPLTLLTLFILPTAANACTTLTSAPTGYASPSNVYSPSDLLVDATCTDDGFTPEVGHTLPTDGTAATYARGYVHDGTQWQPYDLTPTDGASRDGDWIMGPATGSQLDYETAPTYFVAFTCQWRNSSWRCGCQDTNCATPLWQLQGVQQPRGDGGGMHEADADLFESNVCTQGLPTVEVRPGDDLNRVINSASCGTAVMVREGVYRDNIFIQPKKCTADNPLLIVSADGIGKAELRVAEQCEDGFQIRGGEYLGIYGFKIVTDSLQMEANTDCAQSSGIDTSSGSAPSSHLVIAGNIFEGRSSDGIKIASRGSNSKVIGNVILGRPAESPLDVVGYRDSIWAYNEFRPPAGHNGKNNTLGKSGSRNIVVRNNYFGDTGSASVAQIGGIGCSITGEGPSWPANQEDGYDASNFHVYENVFEGTVRFQGGQNSLLEENFIGGNVEERSGGCYRRSVGGVVHPAKNNIIRNNVITGAHRNDISRNEGVSSNSLVENNTKTGPRPDVGPEVMPASALHVCPR